MLLSWRSLYVLTYRLTKNSSNLLGEKYLNESHCLMRRIRLLECKQSRNFESTFSCFSLSEASTCCKYEKNEILNTMYVRRDMTKATKWLCAQQRLRSACASAQSVQSLLSTQWVAKDLSFLHADSEDSDQTGRMPRLIWVFAVRTVTLLVLSLGGSYIDYHLSMVSISFSNKYNCANTAPIEHTKVK